MHNDPTAVPPPSSSPPQAPRSLLGTHAVIVGGGPVGATLAAVLHLRGMRVTLVERSADLSKVEVARSYTLLLNSHALGTLRSVPGLFASLEDRTTPSDALANCVLRPDGTTAYMEIPFGNPVTGQFILRPDLIQGLHEFLRGKEGVEVLYGTTISGVDCDDDGIVTLHLKDCMDDAEKEVNPKESKRRTLRSKLVFACDGKNSAVLAGLRKQAHVGGPVQTSRGLDDQQWHSPASDVIVKSITVDPSIHALIESAHGQPLKQATSVTLDGAGTGDRKFFIMCWPMCKHGCGTIGGRLAAFASLPGSHALKLDNVEDGFKFFEESFPQVSVRELVSEESMRSFVESRGTRLGDIRRVNSLVAHVGGPQPEVTGGGVVFLGDAAHSFPPDLGQGVNVAIEDVGVFANVLDGFAGEKECTLRDVLEQYETTRNGATDGIMYAMRHGFPWQYRQSKPRLMVWALKTVVLTKLAKVLPSVFSPPVATMARNGVSFDEVQRRSMESFRRLCAGVGLLAVGVAISVGRRRIGRA